MNVQDALRNRKSVRAYLDTPVSREKIRAILDAARHAPSGTNAQPWEVAVVSGEAKAKICKAMEDCFAGQDLGEMEYKYYPDVWKAPFKKRRVACGSQLYSALGIDRKDRAARMQQWAANYRAFDAPVILFFFLDRSMAEGSLLDYGMFLQSVMLAALEQGLSTCAQAALGQYPQIVRKHLGYDEEMMLLCGMALGYEDTSASQNNYRTEREEVEVFTTFFE